MTRLAVPAQSDAGGPRPSSGEPDRPVEPDERRPPVHRADLARIALIGLAAAVLGTGWGALGSRQVLGLIATVIGGYPIFKEAFDHLLERRMTMELSMTIALVAALLIGETLTALLIAGFVLVAEVFERLTVSRGRRAIGQLLQLLPRQAAVRREGAFVAIPADRLQRGDRVRVLPGGRIPVDGVVVDGESFVDQASITGEPLPAAVRPGSRVFAGTINQSGALEILAEGIGRETTFGHIIEAVEQAGRSRAPIQKIADRLSGYLVYAAAGAALVTFVVTHDLRATIAVIIVAGACGVAAGTPLAILGAVGRAARFGAVIKGGIHLEALWSIDTVVFDKTGTLTFGDIRVEAVYPATAVSVRAVLEAAATAESRSEHPIGRAIVKHAEANAIPVREPARFSSVPGQGVRAVLGSEEILVGNSRFVTAGRMFERPDDVDQTTVFVVRGGRFLGSVVLADMPRPEAQQAIATLRVLGIKSYLLTGDSRGPTERVARSLGVDHFEAGLMPDAKLDRVHALTKHGRVAMVGDGVNDAPALVAATVGVAMGSGTDVAKESADIVLIGNDLLRLVDTVRLARQTRRIILQNFVGTVVVDVVGIALAAAGHVVSELAFILNSARLVPR